MLLPKKIQKAHFDTKFVNAKIDKITENFFLKYGSKEKKEEKCKRKNCITNSIGRKPC